MPAAPGFRSGRDRRRGPGRAITARRSLPYGGPRGGGPTGWVSDRSFVGGTLDDAAGLTHIGSREYDPHTGRFISVDPVLRPADPQQVAGAYGYGKNNPMTYADPTGLEPRPWHSSEFDQETFDYDTYMKGEARAGYGSYSNDPVYRGCGVAVSACGTDRDPRNAPATTVASQDEKQPGGNPIMRFGRGVADHVKSVVTAPVTATKDLYDTARNGTVGWCAGADTYAGFGFGGGGCVTVSGFTDWGLTANGRFGGGSPSLGVHTGPMWSSAKDPSQLGGAAAYAGGSVVIGPDVGVTVGGEASVARDRAGNTITGGTAEIGVGAAVPIPFEVHSGMSWTWTWG